MTVYLTNFLHARQTYRNSELWRTIEGQSAFVGLVSQDFDVLEEPSRVTSGLQAVASYRDLQWRDRWSRVIFGALLERIEGNRSERPSAVWSPAPNGPGRERGETVELVERKNFDAPDEASESYEKVHGDWIQLMGQDVGRMTAQPGWNWTEHSAPVDGTERCERFHVKLFISGRFAVAYEDGTQAEFGPGDIAVIQPGHDAWVVGDEPVVYFSLGPLFKKAAGQA